MKEWKHIQEEAAKRNHRKIGQVSHAFQSHLIVRAYLNDPYFFVQTIQSQIRLGAALSGS